MVIGTVCYEGTFGPMDDSGNPGKGIVAERLNGLFAPMPGREKPYTLREVANGINTRAGEHLVTVQYLSQLRRGTRRTPSIPVLEAIGGWFGVGPDYFLSSEVPALTPEERRYADLMHNPRVRRATLLAGELDPEILKLMIELMESFGDGRKQNGSRGTRAQAVPRMREAPATLKPLWP